MSVYYNDFDSHATTWLEALIKSNELPPGRVDSRSISDVSVSDLDGHDHHHFFAGIGGWPLALRMSSWPNDLPIWTGSCPCQPFSNANRAHESNPGRNNEKHLWPIWFDLIYKLRPFLIVGEQVPAAIDYGWLDEVFDDFKTINYATGAIIISANLFGASHERKRLYWMAHSGGKGWPRPISQRSLRGESKQELPFADNAFIAAKRALGGNYSGLLSRNGVSLAMERSAIRGYGNAIVPQCAAAFLGVVREIITR